MKIRLLTSKDAQRWDEYVFGHEQGTIFHLLAWKRVVEESFGHKSFYLLAESKDAGGQSKIVGVLPLFQIKSLLFGNSLISVPFAELGGVLADNPECLDALLKEAKALSASLSVDYLELRNKEPLPGLPRKNLYYNFKKEILPDPEQNLQAIPRKSRRMVRSGIKKNLQVEFGRHQLEDFYNLLSLNYHRLGTPIFPKKFFRNFLKVFGDKSDLLIIKTETGQTIAGVLSFYFKDQVIPYYAGSDFEFRRLAPNDFMYWKLMEKACLDGYKWFDFGRSKVDTGSFSFKKHWGFEPQPLAYQYILNKLKELPNISPANPKYQKKIEMWKKMPFGLTKMVGPFLAKYLA